MPKSIKNITGPSPQVIDVDPSLREWNVRIEANPGATGIVTIKYTMVGGTQRTTMTTVNLAGLTEPFIGYFEARLDDFEFSHASLVGSYNAIVDGV